jgi:ferredoxin-NADP reductase
MIPASTLDFWGAKIAPAWSWHLPKAVIVGREIAADGMVTLLLRPNRHWCGAAPGQHINVSFEVDGRRVTRCYSPSAVPGRPDCIAITIKQIEGGRLSSALCQSAQVGDVLDLGQAFGDMSLEAGATGPLHLLAAGSGITPMIAMVRALAADGMPRPLRLHYWARHPAELAFVDELRALARRHARFKVRFHLTQARATHDDESEGRIDERTFAPASDTLAHSTVLACGPQGFVDRARALLAHRVATFVSESFTPIAAHSEDTGDVAVTMAASQRTLKVPRGTPLLTALEALGVSVASGCRRGICNTCACEKRSGSSLDLLTGTTANDAASALRLCVSAAVTDLVLEL